MTIVNFFLCFVLVNIKNLGILIKIAGYGVLTIISYTIFILYVFIYYSIDYDTTLFNSYADVYKSLTLFAIKDVGVMIINYKFIIAFIYFKNYQIFKKSLAGTGAMAFAV